MVLGVNTVCYDDIFIYNGQWQYDGVVGLAVQKRKLRREDLHSPHKGVFALGLEPEEIIEEARQTISGVNQNALTQALDKANQIDDNTNRVRRKRRRDALSILLLDL